MGYTCKKCGKSYSGDFEGWRCECGGSLWLDREVKFSRSDIRENDFSLWRYDKAYPIKRKELLATFGEGLTPLTQEVWDGYSIYLKNDSLMPTGSFKDRGVSMMINHLALKGVNKITEDSSGNAGASVAEYAAKAGMECNIFVPQGTSEGKVAQVISSGAKLHKILGPREKTAQAAQSFTGGVYASHNWNPYFIEGVKSIAYEIWEQLGFTVADNIICPVGNGSIALGIYQGFRELLRNSEVNKLPKIYGVEPHNSNAIYRSFHGLDENFSAEPTIAEGIALRFSSKSNEVVEAVRNSKGQMLEATEGEIVEGLKKVSRMGYFIEPTSAAAFAGLSGLISQGILKKDEKTVVIISGNGLKASDRILQLM